MKYLLWDIDGTLLRTNYAGVAALKKSIKTIYGIDNFQFTNDLAGRTDTFIAKEAIKEIKGHSSPEEITALLTRYTATLPQYLGVKEGYLLPNVKSTLEDLQHSSQVSSLLLTGNCEKAAAAKLDFFSIREYFDFKLSAFGEVSDLREDLARAAWQKLQKLGADINDVMVIGDTPHDITCAAAIGAKSLIVTTGSTFSKEELNTYKPWKIISELPKNSEEFLSIIFSEA
jgi:phosphoglycolate phosphatase